MMEVHMDAFPSVALEDATENKLNMLQHDWK